VAAERAVAADRDNCCSGNCCSGNCLFQVSGTWLAAAADESRSCQSIIRTWKYLPALNADTGALRVRKRPRSFREYVAARCDSLASRTM
jgi:hypothetical protein